jgi:hypothetical protein
MSDTKSKHTPGPWFGRPHHNPVGICGCDEVGLQIAFITSASEERRDEFKANARLIAAAPDLLEALQAAVASGIIPKTSAADGGAARHSEQVRIADMCRAAIAKATVAES